MGHDEVHKSVRFVNKNMNKDQAKQLPGVIQDSRGKLFIIIIVFIKV